MSIDANEYARLSNDSYNDRSQEKNSNKTVSIGGIDYKILDVANDPKTGYQGSAYQRMDTGEVVIAHRGTEPDAKDVKADAGMSSTDATASSTVLWNLRKGRWQERGKRSPTLPSPLLSPSLATPWVARWLRSSRPSMVCMLKPSTLTAQRI